MAPAARVKKSSKVVDVHQFTRRDAGLDLSRVQYISGRIFSFTQGDYQDDNAVFSTKFPIHPDQHGPHVPAQPPGNGHRHCRCCADGRYERQRVCGAGRYTGQAH
jgi:hypothetical protein